MLALLLILIGILLRFAPHAPNFTPVAAIALFGAVYLSKRSALVVPLLLMVVSDAILGLHNVVIFTWLGFMVATLMGFWVKKHKSFASILGAGVISSISFYIISNFGVWVMGWYPHTLKGLADCFILALPFLRNFTLATVVYCAIFFGVYEAVKYFVKGTKLAKALLTV
jgi:hypothetical protein